MKTRVARTMRYVAALGTALVVAAAMLSIVSPSVASAATPAYVQGASAQVGSGTTASVAFPGANTAGNLIVAYVVWNNTGTVTVSDSKGNTYTAGTARQTWGSNFSSEVFYAPNIAGGANTVKATFGTALTSFGIVYAHEYSGLATASPVDVSASAVGTTASMSSGAVSTTSANDLLFAAGVSSDTVTTPGTGFTARLTGFGNLTEDRLASTTGSYAGTATQNGTTWVMQLLAFKAAPAGIGPSAKLAFVVGPSNATAGSVIAPAVKVAVEDASGNIETSDNATSVTLAIGTNPGGGTLSGGTAVTVSSGIATFPGVSINTAGTGYTLTASSTPTYTSATSGAFNITTSVVTQTPAYVQGASAQVGSGTTASVAFPGANTAGNLIVAYVVWNNTGTVTVSDSKGNTYTAGTARQTWGSNFSSEVFYAPNIAGGANTVKATFGTALTSFGIVYAHEYSGLATASPVDVSASAVGTTASMSSGAVSTTSANDLLFAAGVSSDTVTTPGTGFTARLTGFGNLTEDRLASTTGSYAGTATQNGTTWVMQLLAFKAAPAGIGPSAKLAFVVGPSNATAGSVIAPAVKVAVEDASGNIETSDNATSVTLAIGTNPGGGTLSGGTAVTVSSGIATFPGVSINTAGTGYTLTASSTPTYTSATSGAFNITTSVGPSTKLAFVVGPSNATAGSVIAPAVKVAVEDASGNIETSDNATSVTLAIGTNPGGGTLSGGTAVTVSSGIATFPGVSINTAGTGYTLTASSTPTYTAATSGAFTISASVVTPTYVQGASAQVGSGTTASVAFPSANTAGNLIVVYVLWDNPGTVTVSDAKGNPYMPGTVRQTWGTNWSSEVFYVSNVLGGTNTVKATFGTAITSFGIVYAHEYSGVATASTLDTSASAVGTAASMSSGSVVTSAANDLLFDAGASSNTVTTPGTGFSARLTSFGNLTEDRLAATTGSYAGTATQNGTAWVMQLVAFRAGSSGGSGGTTLPSGAFSSMAIDPVNDHVFVSLPTNGIVEVLDFSGNIIDTITGFGTRYDVTNQDNDIIYADNAIYMTDTANGTIDRIDPSTMAVTVLATGLVLPLDLVYSAGSLWAGSGAYAPSTLEGIDITTGAVTSYPNVPLAGSGLIAGAGLPDTIFSYNAQDNPLVISRIDVELTPTVTATQDELGVGSTPAIGTVRDIAVSPDGSHLVPAAVSNLVELNTSNLLGDGVVYPVNFSPTADAITSAKGGLLAAGLSGDAISSSLYSAVVYRLGNPSDQLLSIPLPGLPVYRGVAFSPDGNLLFVVTAGVGYAAPAQFEVEKISVVVSS